MSVSILVHIRLAKGNKDRCVSLPEAWLNMLRQHWLTHHNRNGCFLPWLSEHGAIPEWKVEREALDPFASLRLAVGTFERWAIG